MTKYISVNEYEFWNFIVVFLLPVEYIFRSLYIDWCVIRYLHIILYHILAYHIINSQSLQLIAKLLYRYWRLYQYQVHLDGSCGTIAVYTHEFVLTTDPININIREYGIFVADWKFFRLSRFVMIEIWVGLGWFYSTSSGHCTCSLPPIELECTPTEPNWR